MSERAYAEVWTDRAAAAVASRLVGSGAPWRRGLWVTARVSYRERELPPGFELREVEVEGATRRVAVSQGEGPPLLVLPGLHATLRERLFVDVAALAARAGWQVTLLEDRCAGPTLTANGGGLVDLARQGREVAALAARLGRPDVLAFSAGVTVALAARLPGRVVGWSAVLDPEATARRVRASPLLRAYYGRVVRRAWRGLPMPPIDEVWESLAADAPPHEGDAFLVHAADDPVAPVEPVLASPLPRCVVPVGGHLGFGVLDAPSLYLLPLAQPRATSRFSRSPNPSSRRVSSGEPSP